MDWMSENDVVLSSQTICWSPPLLHNRKPMKGVCWKNCFENEESNGTLDEFHLRKEQSKIYCPPMNDSDVEEEDE